MEFETETYLGCETTNFTISNKKCGEIFVQPDEKFFITCTFCVIQFTEFEEFTLHYENSHLNKYIKPFNLKENVFNFIKLEPDETDDFKVEDQDDLKVILNYEDEINVEFLDEKNTFCLEKIDSVKNVKKRIRKKKCSPDIPCEICGKMFESGKKIEIHKKKDHRPIINDEFGNYANDNDHSDVFKNYNSINSRKLEQETEINPRQCKFCHRKFLSKNTRIDHERVHTGEKPYKCGTCDKWFSTIRFRKQHELQHSGNKPFKCDLCNATFSVKNGLNKHLRRHAGEKSCSCNYCDKKFFDNADRKIHERTHTGEKPYQCISCGLCFRTSSHLILHVKRFHSNNVIKKHKCEECGKSFLLKSTLNSHVAIHSDLRPFKCEFCEKSFKLRKRLASHLKIHTLDVVTTHACNICGKAFVGPSALRIHMKTHEKA